MIALSIVACALLSVAHAKLTSNELLAEYGLECESHDVVTSDGYVINIFRIPSPGKSPVVIMPGFLSSSNTWIVSPRNQSLVAALADQGYDIWLLNYRGSYYGKKHVSLDPKKDAAKFWDFTFQEIGSRDLPAMVDYVLKETGFDGLFYIGHSMGGLSFYTMCVERPDYCKKVRAAGLLAPVIFPPSAVDRALLASAIQVVKYFAAGARMMGIHEAFGDEQQRAKSTATMCAIPIIGRSLCSLGMTLPFSRSTDNVDQRTLPKYVVNTLSGVSVKLAEHMTQLMTSKKKVPRFDYGRSKNLEKYRSASPPFYTGRVSAPLIVFHSTSDPFTDQHAINLLKKVSTVVYDKLITDKTFNHINFIFSNDVNKYVNNDLLSLFNKIADL